MILSNKFFFIFILIFCDLLSKYIVYQNIDLNNFIPITFYLDIAHIHNFGISFGLFSGYIPPWLIIIIGLLITSLIFYLMNNTKNNIEKIGLTLIISGALGNIMDRSINGYVIDFIYFHHNKLYWPAFNFADIYITVGILLILFQMLIDLSIRLSK